MTLWCVAFRETVVKQNSVKPLQTDGQTLKQIDAFSVLRYGCYLAAEVTNEAHGCLINRAIMFPARSAERCMYEADRSQYLAVFLPAASSAKAKDKGRYSSSWHSNTTTNLFSATYKREQ